MSDPISSYFAQYWGEILAVIIGGAILSVVAWMLDRTQLPHLTIKHNVERQNKGFALVSLDITNEGKTVSVDTVGSLSIKLPKIVRDGRPADIVYGDIVARDYGWDLEGRQKETYDLHPRKGSGDSLYVQVMSFHQESTGEYGLFFQRQNEPKPILSGRGEGMMFIGKNGQPTPDFRAEAIFTVRGMTADGTSISEIKAYDLEFPGLGLPGMRDIRKVRLVPISRGSRSKSPVSSPVSSPASSSFAPYSSATSISSVMATVYRFIVHMGTWTKEHQMRREWADYNVNLRGLLRLAVFDTDGNRWGSFDGINNFRLSSFPKLSPVMQHDSKSPTDSRAT